MLKKGIGTSFKQCILTRLKHKKQEAIAMTPLSQLFQ